MKLNGTIFFNNAAVSIFMKKLMLFCALFIFVMSMDARAEEESDKNKQGCKPPDSRLEYIEKLIEDSSAAKQIKKAGSDEAKAQHEKAKDLFFQAVDAQYGGKNAVATRLLNEAVKTMYSAANMAKPESVVRKKRKRDFDNYMKSTQVLLEAQQRISKEKGLDNADNRSLVKQVKTLREKARDQYASKQYDTGFASLAKAYELLKTSIEKMRGGDVLVRTLNFATKEDEYHYEIDRNDTHRMLYKVLLKKQKKGKDQEDGADNKLAEAIQLRSKAEAYARDGDYEMAVKTLEKSTKVIIRVIRRAGVFIPG